MMLTSQLMPELSMKPLPFIQPGIAKTTLLSVHAPVHSGKEQFLKVSPPWQMAHFCANEYKSLTLGPW